MTASEFWTLVKCMPRMIAAVITGNKEALDNVERDVEATHAAIDARKAGT